MLLSEIHPSALPGTRFLSIQGEELSIVSIKRPGPLPEMPPHTVLVRTHTGNEEEVRFHEIASLSVVQ